MSSLNLEKLIGCSAETKPTTAGYGNDFGTSIRLQNPLL